MIYNHISNQEMKMLSSLSQKKYRDNLMLFRAEGSKVIESLIPFFSVELVVVPDAGERDLSAFSPRIVRTVSEAQNRKLSLLESPGDMIAIFRKRQPLPLDPDRMKGLTVALDSIQNPGNLGTIIRLCDWLGITTLLLGEGCVDPFNPKVVQATAGALGAVTIHEHLDLHSILPTFHRPIIGTALDGEDVGQFTQMADDAIVLFGNEGHGMSEDLKAICTQLIRIPDAPTTVSESLNVSISAAIILSHIAFIS